MYDWRISCRENAIAYANRMGLHVGDSDFGHLEHFHYGGEQSCLAMSRALNLCEGERGLDLGCGIGGSARSLWRSSGRQIVGVDTNPAFIQYAKTHSPDGLEFHVGEFAEVDPCYDAWFALLLFVHIEEPLRLVEAVQKKCRSEGRFWVETMVGDLHPVLGRAKTWTMADVEVAFPTGIFECMNARWRWWTKERVERFLDRRSFFEELYGNSVVQRRCAFYEGVAEGFARGTLSGCRIVGENCKEFEDSDEFDEVCIIEFDQFENL